MLKDNSFRLFLIIVLGLSGLMVVTSTMFMSEVRFGIEFRGGYEIYYEAEPKSVGEPLTLEILRKTAALLRQRVDSIGMSEPEINIEGKNHIRLKVAGLTSAEQVRSILGSSADLPAQLTEKYTQTVGSVLGNTSLKETLLAGAVGTGFVFLLLIVLYRKAGLIASFCLLVYLWLLMVLFNAVHATLSLSAIVAFVLGIGMAADATIISFERIKEELRKKGNVFAAFRDGFQASFITIRDANCVTAIAMVALFAAGIGPIQGFSLTMLMSMLVSVLTNVFLARFLCGLVANSNLMPTSLSAENCSSKWTALNYSRWGRTCAVASVLIIAAGTWYYTQHGLNLDIDFTAGTALDIDIDRAIEQSKAESVMVEAGIVPATVAIGGDNNQHIAARFDEILSPSELNQIIAAFKGQYSKVNYEENTADPTIAHEFAVKAVYALLSASICIVLFIGFRFSWPVALAVQVSIAHDLLLVSAIFALFKFEIDVTYVAAMLTVMGYSLNDKIVIFDRIRENLAMERLLGENRDSGKTYAEEVVNASIRQTLGRSIYTVLTVVLASTSLFLLGCEPLQMFALAILLGLISGAYSSIFLACPLWIALRVRGSKLQVSKL